MAKYCKYCGKELINDKCDCEKSMANEHVLDKPIEDVKKYSKITIMKSMNLDFSSIRAFFDSYKASVGLLDIDKNGNPYEYNIPIVPDCIEPEKNEVVVKQYNVALMRSRIKRMRAEGRLMVTNRRLLFRAAGTSPTGSAINQHQFALDEIAGIDISKNYSFNIFDLILYLIFIFVPVFTQGMLSSIVAVSNSPIKTLALIVISIVLLVLSLLIYKHGILRATLSTLGTIGLIVISTMTRNGSDVMKYVVALAIIISLYNVFLACITPNLTIKIMTKGASPSFELSNDLLSIKDGYSEVLPWEDTDMAIAELGTLIEDLQKNGDYAIEKWSR